MPQPQALPQQTLAQSIRAKFPGVYDDMSDQQLEQSVLAKYPQYSDMPRTTAQSQSVAPPPTDAEMNQLPAQIGKGIGKGALNTVSGVSSLLNKIPFLGKYLAPTEGVNAMKQMATPQNLGEKVGFGGEQAGEFMIPGMGEEDLARGAAKLPFLGEQLASHPRALSYGADVLRSGAQSQLQGTGFLPGAAAGAVGGAIGKGARAVGGKIARSAVGVTDKQLRYGAQPEDEILNLPGIRPATIKASAAQKATQLTQEMESKLEQAKSGVDLRPAKQVVMSAIDKASSQNDLTTLNHLQPLFDQVSSLPDQAPARQALEYKRGLNSLTKFNQLAPVTDAAKAASRSAYSAIDSEIDKVAPEANEMNDRIHSLLTISGARGGGHMGLGKYIVPMFLAHAAGMAGAGPVGELGAMALSGMAERPASRIGIGKAIGKGVPNTIKGTYPLFLRYVAPQLSGGGNPNP